MSGSMTQAAETQPRGGNRLLRWFLHSLAQYIITNTKCL